MRKLRTYDVEVKRTGWGWNEIRVQARTPAQAKKIALGSAGNYLYSEKDADYEVESITEVPDGR